MAILTNFRPRRILILILIIVGVIAYLSGFHLPTGRSPGKPRGYWERTGRQEIYDRHWMERLDFSSPDLIDNCSAIQPFPPRRIPKIVHYVYGLKADFDKTGFGYLQYAAVKSAYDNLNADEIILHYRFLPPDSNIYWARTKPLFTKLRYLTEDVTEIFGNPVVFIPHKADIVRMQVLQEWGGIYLDIDVIVLQSFDPLLHHEFVMGQEANGEHIGMANAIMLSHKDSPFLKRWWDQYKTFDGENWNFHSVVLPYKLSLEYPNELCRLPRVAFFYPAYFFNHVSFINEEDEFVFGGQGGFQYAYHVSNRASSKYLENKTLVDVVAKNTSMNRLLRRYLPDDWLQEAEAKLMKEIKEGKRDAKGNIF